MKVVGYLRNIEDEPNMPLVQLRCDTPGTRTRPPRSSNDPRASMDQPYL